MNKKKIIVIGAGGCAKVVGDIILQQENIGIEVKLIGFIDDNYGKDNKIEIFGRKFLGKIDKIEEFKGKGYFYVFGIGNNEIRKKLEDITDNYYTAIHPKAIIGEEVIIERGTVVMAGAVINSYSKIGKHCIINTGAIVEHDCIVEDFVHISPNATLCGGVTIENECWIGAGSVVIQGLRVKENTIVGAGSVVVKDLPVNCTAVGIPARPIKFNVENN